MTYSNKLVKLLRFFILIGTIMVCLNILFNDTIVPFVTEEVIPNTNMTWYKIHIHEYLENVKNTVQDTTALELHTNPLSWLTTDASVTSSEFWDVFGNNALFILNYIIFALNILIYPLKVGGYALCVVLSALGIVINNNQTDISWLTNLAVTFRGLEIPYMT